jgi:hypothetical protein
MKTPEEIKEDLAAWGTGVRIDIGCGEFVPPCPEYMLNGVRSADVCRDALAYIQQLEQIALHWQSSMDQVQKALQENGFQTLEELLQAYSQVKRERDAAVEDLRAGHRCFVCKKFFHNGGRCSGGRYCVPLVFEWRGVQEKEEEHEADSD